MRRGAIDPDEEFRLKKELASRLDAEAILDHYGAENAYEQTNAHHGTREIVHSCLIDRVRPHHANGDANPSASCDVDRGLYVCYSYTDPETKKSGMDMISLVMLLEGKEHASDVVDLLNPYLEGSTLAADDFRKRVLAIFDPADAPVVTSTRTHSSRTLDGWAYIHPYLQSRGITDETASRLQIGYDPAVNRITIPHFVSGALVGWQKRAIPAGHDEQGPWPATKPAIPKYKNSPGFPKSSTLYRYDEALATTCGRVIVVESPFSVIKADSLDLGPEYPVVATFGAKITNDQIELLRRVKFTEIVLWMDADDAGWAAERKLMGALHGATIRVVDSQEGVDLGDYDDADDARSAIDGAMTARERMLEELWATKCRA